jgi:type I restriction enzyme M protein
VVPDNVLFEGGAAAAVRLRLLETLDVHTLLRLPTGLFYAQGVKANVLFFDKPAARSGPASPELWVYDLRSSNRFTLKTRPLQRDDLADFVRLYRPGDGLCPGAWCKSADPRRGSRLIRRPRRAA